jgi:rSAM/selenodomain-associated transferase 1
VKARLAEDVGASTAAEVYQRIGREVVTAAAGSGYRTVVWYTPAEEGPFVREWLNGVGRVEFRPQGAGALAARVNHAMTVHFAEGADRVVLIGTDCPGLNRRLVEEAFTALGSHDVILGPAVDGGVYLFGLRHPQPSLLQAVPRASGGLAAQLRVRARGLGLSLTTLRPLRDVDTATDARLLGYLNS